jgi:hypothetical protein
MPSEHTNALKKAETFKKIRKQRAAGNKYLAVFSSITRIFENMSDRIHNFVITFLETELPGTELTQHEDILNYAILGALDQDVEDIDEEIIQENLSAYCTIFNVLPEDEQLHLVRRLISQVSAHRQQPADSDTQQPTTSLIAACLSQIKIRASSSSSSPSSDVSSSSSEAKTDEEQALHMLRELLPEHLAQPINVIPNEYLLHILRLNHNNREATASWLLEQSCNTNDSTNTTRDNSLIRKVERWRHQLQEKESQVAIAKREKEETRKQIVQKYALQVVPDGNQPKKTTSTSSSNKRLLPPPIKVKASSSGDQQSSSTKVRYREGVVVSRKNEKYIIEKIGEDWDGGSKGKVYTKGKRGKGFI